MEEKDYRRRQRTSWCSTLLTQITLLIVLFFSLHFGKSQKNYKRHHVDLDLYFISVHGGYRPLQHQNHLLKQMAEVAETYKVKFVLNINEFGDDDPLLNNGTEKFQSLNIPWYSTRVTKGKQMGYFSKEIKMPHDNVLQIIVVDTSLFLDSQHKENGSSGESDQQLYWLLRILQETDAHWRIGVGLHPIKVCEEEVLASTNVYEPLHLVLLEYGVNAYLSKKGTTGYYFQDGSISYIGNPVFFDEEKVISSETRNHTLIEEINNGFILHRVSPLEIESYFISSERKIVFKSTVHQWGKEAV